MKIKKILLQNFLTFGEKEQSIELSDLTTIVGPNDSGKTNVFRAITTIADILSNRIADSKSFHHFGNLEKPFKIQLDIEFSDDEKTALYNFLFCGSLQQDIHRTGEERQEPAIELNTKIIQKYASKFFANFFDDMSIIALGKGLEKYQIEPILKITKNKKELYIHDFYTITSSIERTRHNSTTGVGNLLYDKIKEQNKEAFSKYLKEETTEIPDLEIKVNNLFDYCYNLLNNGKISGINIHQVYFEQFERENRGMPDEAKRLRAFLLDRGDNDNGYTILKMIAIIFENSIIRTSNIRSFPEQSILEINTKMPSLNLRNVNGKNLPFLLFNLKNNPEKKNRDSFKTIISEFEKIFTELKLDVMLKENTTTSQRRDLTTVPQQIRDFPTGVELLGIRNTTTPTISRELEIQITKNNIAIPLESAAAGVFEAIFILTCILGHKNKTILLDEPALNLHPNLQKRILQLIKVTIKKNNNHIILITHSPYLIDTDNFKNSWRFNYQNNSTIVSNLKQVLNLDEKEEQKISLKLQNSEIRSILFSKGLILVEGPSDKIVIEKLNKHLSENDKGPKLDENEWSIIDMDGKDNLHLFSNLARLLKIPNVIIMDYDAMMHCSKKIHVTGVEVKTSLIIHYLNNSGLLTKSELGIIQNLQKYIKTIPVPKIHGTKEVEHKQQWYDEKCLEDLNKIVRKHNFFVFTKDLENALQKPTTKKENKPLKALDAVLKQISEHRVSSELSNMMKFVSRFV